MEDAIYAYNGLGDRLSQNGINYTLDLNSGLTQVLNDGTNTYLYGVGRIAQVNTTTEYFLGDALGSVRQLTNSQGDITLANAYDPYGNLAQTGGSTQTSYGFTGEYTDPGGMMYLRARYYLPGDGRFLTRDMWMGDYNSPLSLNRWIYVEGNPINYTDPSGFCGKPGEHPCPVPGRRENGAGATPDWWINESHLYVSGYGYFDAGHIGRGWDSAVYIRERFGAVIEKGGTIRLASGELYWADYLVSSKVKKLREVEKFGVMYAIYTDFERGYEAYQSKGWLGWVSGFAPEDLPSDHLGFWANLNGYGRNDVPALLNCLGEVYDLGNSPVRNLVFKRYSNEANAGFTLARNYEFMSMIKVVTRKNGGFAEHTKNVAWPSWLEIQPIPSGPNTWQKISEGHA